LWRLGAVPVVLAHPRRPDPDRLKATVAERASAVAAAAVVVDRAFAGPLGTAAGGAPVLTLDDVEHGPRSALPPMPHPDDLGLLQFTSGTTAASKIVPVRQGQIVGNIGRCVSALGLTPADTYVSWLPFYHDMGIISVAGLLAHGLHVVVMATETFLRRPAAWMETVSTCQAAITAGPDSGYALAARAQELRPQRLDLSGLRVAINGAEPVSPENVESALRAFGPVGMRPESMCATYGLAEATLVATIQRPAVPPVFLAPDEVRASVGLAPPRRPVASCGHPLDDTLIEIRDETGAPLPDGAVGEIFISGPGVMHGYWRGPRADAGADAPSGVENAWLPTGDLGLLRNGELYVCGRAKDMIIVGGRNLYPEDYERVAE
ncbi:MAG: AMP-binding protein, partial [Actinomadura rubrobrunea]|nr:AMP-binding protein [Actinomadura rubrobrunea]